MPYQGASYTPDVGEKGLLHGLLYVQSFGNIYVSGIGEIWSTSGEFLRTMIYTYEKTDSSTINLSLQSDDGGVITGEMYWGNYDGPYDPTSYWDSFYVQNSSGVLSPTGGPSGSESGYGESPPNVVYGGYDDVGTWDGGYPTVNKLLYVWPHFGGQKRAFRGIGRGLRGF